ncbi:cellulose synthase operon protein YhjQ/BcsQ [Acidisoma cladoniae]|jgi:cellulose synthase operon protein YhjQ|uniref:cellulose synthase operon protein YhjQ/BcsQ n=1 Tax=Acidisoma cladoniae TaxID=3040935 RepID=UPI00254D17B2|nr:cellulose synthase operon protein YhjQ/BcsQ [Acidisoma sp. PAMC 29798]
MPLIAFASPKGGVGKTTLAANIAHEFARQGRRVVVLDLDTQNALGMHFGADPYERAGFITSLKDATDPRNAWQSNLQQTPSGISLLAHGHTTFAQSFAINAELVANPDLLLAPLQDILADPEIVIIADTPPGPGVASSVISAIVNYMVVVLLADAASIVQLPKIEGKGMYRGAGGLPFPIDRIGFVINQIDMRSRLSRAAAEAAERHLGSRLLGRVYRDEHVPEALARQASVAGYAPSSKAAQDITAIAIKIAAAITPNAERGADTAPLTDVHPGGQTSVASAVTK